MAKNERILICLQFPKMFLSRGKISRDYENLKGVSNIDITWQKIKEY
jgi:hypothetical protein